MTTSGTTLPDSILSYGRLCCRGVTLSIDPINYVQGFADGDISGTARGYAVALGLAEETESPDLLQDGLTAGVRVAEITVSVAFASGFSTGQASGLAAGFSIAYDVADDPSTQVAEGLAVGLATGAAGNRVDVTPPAISNITPTPGATPGDPGGFPSDPSAARVTPVQFDVVDLAPGLAGVIVMARFNDLDGRSQPTFVVHNGSRFLPPFNSASVRSGDPLSGYHFSVRHNSGWPITDPPSSIHFDVVPVDSAGNITGGLPP